MALDPFAGRSPMRAEPNAGELRDPFANPTMQPAPMGTVLNPFRERGDSGPTGTVVINTIPWSRVSVDGHDTGQNTPIRALRLTPGRHRIDMLTQDGTVHTTTITVEAGKTIRLMRRL